MTLPAIHTRPAGLVAALFFSATVALAAPTLPEGVRRIADLAYGQDARQRMPPTADSPSGTGWGW